MEENKTSTDSSTITIDNAGGADTLTIQPLDLSAIDTIDLSGLASVNYNWNTIGQNSFNYGSVGATGNQHGYYNYTTNTTNPTITSAGFQGVPTLKVNGNAEFDADIKIKGRSLEKMLEKIEDRLAIISDPDPAKLEKFKALKKAYDHYKTLEKLIGPDWKDEEAK